jgi:hypothetical protein
MIPLNELLLFAGAALLLVLTPGPNMIYLLSRSICQGRGAGQDTVHEGLHGIRRLMHKLGDELVGDAIKGADYVARIGRLLGM